MLLCGSAEDKPTENLAAPCLPAACRRGFGASRWQVDTLSNCRAAGSSRRQYFSRSARRAGRGLGDEKRSRTTREDLLCTAASRSTSEGSASHQSRGLAKVINK